MTVETNDQNFQTEVLESDIPVVVDFWAPWCQPCKQLAPIIEQVAKDLEGKVKIVKHNVDDGPQAPSKYMVRGIPTMILFKGGQVVDNKVGSVSKEVLTKWIEENT